VQNHKIDPATYDFVNVSQVRPRASPLRRNQVKFTTPVNTGISSAPPRRHVPVYERFLSTTMSGTNPTGRTTATGHPVVSYFNGGDALHEFPRYSYGFPRASLCRDALRERETVFPTRRSYTRHGQSVARTSQSVIIDCCCNFWARCTFDLDAKSVDSSGCCSSWPYGRLDSASRRS